MEQISGGDLFNYSKWYVLSEKQVALIMHQMIQAIQYIHSCGVVHRDIKPENILIIRHQKSQKILQIKLADFGLSQVIVPGKKLMQCCGTPAYVAPEILFQKGYGKEIDVWAAGIIFYTLVCNGYLPFKLIDKNQLFNAIKFEMPDTYNNNFCFQARETQDLILRMLRKNPDDRITPEEALNHKYFKQNAFNFKVYNTRKQKHLLNIKLQKLHKQLKDQNILDEQDV